MDKAQRREIAQAIEAARAAKPSSSPGSVAGVAIENLADHWPAIRDQIAVDYVSAQAGRAIQRAAELAQSPQAWLDLPEYQHIPAEVQNDSLEDYRERIVKLETKIKSYAYPRRSEQNVKRDKQELRELKRLDPKIAPFFAGAPDMIVGKAAELYKASLERPVSRRSQKANKARWARTGNQ